ncbi:DUF3943 domain-containing protein [Methylibium sp.]|uniref:DUF3943 domain-containing protein n=1 Tax=Methylibium sp. TaxID=2067992 RepID=UPI003D102C32
MPHTSFLAPRARALLSGIAGLALLLAAPCAAAQAEPKVAAAELPDPAAEQTPADPTATATATATAKTPDKSYAIPALEIIGFDFLLNRYNRRFSGTRDYDVSGASIRRNLRGPWVIDNDPFDVNQFAHPYQGSLYHGAARSTGLSYWEAAGYTFAGSAGWEIAGEQTPPSRNDQIASGIAGSFLGEPLFRMAHLVLTGKSDLPQAWREVIAAGISPSVGFTRLTFGSRFDGAFVDNDPVYYSRLRIGATRAAQDDIGTSRDLQRNEAVVDFALDYGLPGKDGYTYRRPFDYFAFHGVVSSANGVETLATRGLLFGTDYAAGATVRGLWGLYGSYDYVAPQIFNVSTTALSLGTTGQWWASEQVALQGTVLAGLGYSAASTSRRTTDDRDYHYGVAPRLSLALRLISGASSSIDVSAQKYFLGSIANRSAGRDNISRVDTAFTWRLYKRHAVSVKYVWSHRDADYPVIGSRTQTLGTVGVYYTLLGADGFGAVEWRDAAAR